MGEHRGSIVVAALAVVGALVVPAGAEPPSPGKWVVADAAWLFETGPGTARLIEVDVTQHTAVTGEVTTDANAWKGHCKRTTQWIMCSGTGGPRFAQVALTYDPTVSKAHLKMVTLAGRVFRASWTATEPVPYGTRSDASSCQGPDGQSGSSSDYSVTKPATASAHVFGRTLGTAHFLNADIGVGAGTRPCTMSYRSFSYS